jgi:hypothetical protein
MITIALSLLLAAQAPVLLDDPGSSVCLATGFCRQQPAPGPAPGVLFVAVGMVAAGVAGLRSRGKSPPERG